MSAGFVQGPACRTPWTRPLAQCPMRSYAQRPLRSVRCATSFVYGPMRNVLCALSGAQRPLRIVRCATSSASIEGALRFLKDEFAQTVRRTYSIVEITQASTGGTLEPEPERETE